MPQSDSYIPYQALPLSELKKFYKTQLYPALNPEDAKTIADVSIRRFSNPILDFVFDYYSPNISFLSRIGGRYWNSPYLSTPMKLYLFPYYFRQYPSLDLYGPYYDPVTRNVGLAPIMRFLGLAAMRATLQHELGHALEKQRSTRLIRAVGYYPFSILYGHLMPAEYFTHKEGPLRHVPAYIRKAVVYSPIYSEFLANVLGYRWFAKAYKEGLIPKEEALKIARERLAYLSWAISTYLRSFPELADYATQVFKEEGLKYISSKQDYEEFKNISDEEILRRLENAAVEYDKDVEFFKKTLTKYRAVGGAYSKDRLADNITKKKNE